MNNKDAYIEHLENTIVNLNETINGLQNQISLFNEVEIEADSSATEPITKDVRGYG